MNEFVCIINKFLFQIKKSFYFKICFIHRKSLEFSRYLTKSKMQWENLISKPRVKNFLQNKEINALICGQRYDLFVSRQKFIWFEQIFIWSKDIFCLNQTNFVSSKQNISLHQRKCFKQIIFLIQSNIFSECSEQPLIRSDYSLMAAAISLSLWISEIRLMNQWNR